MIKINRTSEYGLIALKYMRGKAAHEVTSAREISDTYGLPFEITAKTLQRLKDSGLIQSAQGAKGGYTLQKPLEATTLAEFLNQMEGPQAMVACSSEHHADSQSCEYHGRCGIKDVMRNLNSRFFEFLSGIRLSEIAGSVASSSGDFHSDKIQLTKFPSNPKAEVEIQ
jgi:Rrf2 family protein